MKRIVKVKNEYGGDSKYTLKQECNGFALYQEKCPTGYFVSQSYLLTNNQITIVCKSFNCVCKDELLDAIDNFNEIGKFGLRVFKKSSTLYIIHSNGNTEI